MIGSREDQVQRLVAHLQARAEGIGMRAALDEAHEILREAQRRVGQAGGNGSGLGEYLTQEPIAVFPQERAA